MKAVLALFVMATALFGTTIAAESESAGEDFNGEFFQGMETGFFLRDTP